MKILEVRCAKKGHSYNIPEGLCLYCEYDKSLAKIEIYEEYRAFYADYNNCDTIGSVGKINYWDDREIIDVGLKYNLICVGRRARECGEKIKAIDNN